MFKGPSIKDVRTQGEGVCPVRLLADKGLGGSSECGRPHFLMQKIRIYRNLQRRTKVEGGASADILRTIFRDFVRTSFMDDT